MRAAPAQRRPLALLPSAPGTSLLWPAMSVYVGIALYLVAAHRDQYPATALAILSFGVFPVLFWRARPLRSTPVCPLNWVLFAFFLQLIVLPLLVCFYGPAQSTLPELPSHTAINVALLLSGLAFGCFCVGYHLVAGRSAVATSASTRSPRAWPTSPALIAVYVGLGILGLALTFHGFGSIVGYFGKASNGLEGLANEGGGVIKVADVVLRTFLGFAVVIAWCRWIDRARLRSTRVLVGGTALAVVAIVVAYGTFAYNRGSFVSPVVAVLAVYGARGARLRVRWLVVMGVVGAVLLTAFRVYRTTDFTVIQAIGNSQTQRQILKHTSVNKELQLYAGAPQFTGFLLERTDYGRNLRWGRTLFASAMYPVPSLGRPFREGSGFIIYNGLIYGPDSTIDQVIPFQGELFINFHVAGVIVGYLLLGAAFALLQRGFDRAPTSVQAFSWQYVATWCAYLVAGAVAVISQIFIYSLWPIFALAIWSRLGPADQRAERPVPGTQLDAESQP